MEFKVNSFLCILIILLFCVAQQIHSKKILCLLGLGTETAQKWNKVLLNSLADKKHELTVVTAESWNSETPTKIHFIHLENNMKFVKKHSEVNNDATPKLLQQSIWSSIVSEYDNQLSTCRGNLESKELSDFLNWVDGNKHSFDMIIYDVTYGPGCLLHFAHIISDIPIVGITSSTLTSPVLSMSHVSILNAALDPHALSDFGRIMNYWTRLYNTILYGCDYVYRQWVVRPVLEGLWSQYVHDKNIFVPKSLSDLNTRFKIILANHHPVLHTITSLPNNVIPVPGLHIKANSSSSLTSSNTSKLKENVKNGVVLIDLEFEHVGLLNVQKIFEVVREFSKTDFIWKVNRKMNLIKNKPTNLILEDKLENQEILDLLKAGQKVKFVLTIPEILRIQECLYHGIPMITLTLKPEQIYLAKRIAEQGFAFNLQMSDLPRLASHFENLLTNNTLRNAALQLQKSFVNRQNPSLDTAIWWVQNLLTNPEVTNYLYTVNRDSLSFISKTSFDVILVFEVFILMCCINTFLVCRQIIKNFKKTSKTKNKSIAKSDLKIKKLKKEKKTKAKMS